MSDNLTEKQAEAVLHIILGLVFLTAAVIYIKYGLKYIMDVLVPEGETNQ